MCCVLPGAHLPAIPPKDQQVTGTLQPHSSATLSYSRVHAKTPPSYALCKGTLKYPLTQHQKNQRWNHLIRKKNSSNSIDLPPPRILLLVILAKSRLVSHNGPRWGVLLLTFQMWVNKVNTSVGEINGNVTESLLRRSAKPSGTERYNSLS